MLCTGFILISFFYIFFYIYIYIYTVTFINLRSIK